LKQFKEEGKRRKGGGNDSELLLFFSTGGEEKGGSKGRGQKGGEGEGKGYPPSLILSHSGLQLLRKKKGGK